MRKREIANRTFFTATGVSRVKPPLFYVRNAYRYAIYRDVRTSSSICSQGAIPVCPQRNGSGKIVNRDPRSCQLKTNIQWK